MSLSVLLISPPHGMIVTSKKAVTPPTSNPPLGLAYLAAVLEKNHIRVDIIDSDALGYGLEDILKKVAEFNPDVVGITGVTPTISTSLLIGKHIKQEYPSIKIVIGGVHAFFKWNEVIKNDFVDFVTVGEAEYSFLKLVKAIESKQPVSQIKGIVFRQNNKTVFTGPPDRLTNLDELPFPSRHLLPNDKYVALASVKLGGKPYASFMTSRGCPFNCSYCAAATLWNRQITYHSAEYVLKEIEHTINTIGAKYIHFVDDTFIIDKERVNKICDGIIEKGWNLKWSAKIRVKPLDEDLLRKMKAAGCKGLYLGIEFGSQRMLNYVSKGITLEDVREAVNLVNKVGGFNLQGYFMLGYPTETKEEILKTIEFAKSLDLYSASFSITMPYPGTPLYHHCKKNHLLLSEHWEDYSAQMGKILIKNENLSNKELKELFGKAYKEFYLRPSYILKALSSIRSFEEIKYYFSQGIKLALN